MEIDVNPAVKQTVSDDPELAKVLAGVNAATSDEEETTLQYEGLEKKMAEMEESVAETPEIINNPTTTPIPTPTPIVSVGGLNLDEIKVHALQDLRPLIDKLSVSNEEKFDIYLLLLRSSDDNTLIEPAYESARNIEDETKRANALLDVIKEIDYFKSKHAA